MVTRFSGCFDALRFLFPLPRSGRGDVNRVRLQEICLVNTDGGREYREPFMAVMERED
jgi:hypothetical protein